MERAFLSAGAATDVPASWDPSLIDKLTQISLVAAANHPASFQIESEALSNWKKRASTMFAHKKSHPQKLFSDTALSATIQRGGNRTTALDRPEQGPRRGSGASHGTLLAHPAMESL